MFAITKEFGFDAAHRLPEHPGKCRNLHGHRYAVHLTLRAQELDARGLLVDFADMKQRFGTWLDETFDHACILAPNDHSLIRLCAANEWKHIVLDAPPTAEVLAKIMLRTAREHFPAFECSVRIYETPTSWAEAS